MYLKNCYKKLVQIIQRLIPDEQNWQKKSIIIMFWGRTLQQKNTTMSIGFLRSNTTKNKLFNLCLQIKKYVYKRFATTQELNLAHQKWCWQNKIWWQTAW